MGSGVWGRPQVRGLVHGENKMRCTPGGLEAAFRWRSEPHKERPGPRLMLGLGPNTVLKASSGFSGMILHISWKRKHCDFLPFTDEEHEGVRLRTLLGNRARELGRPDLNPGLSYRNRAGVLIRNLGLQREGQVLSQTLPVLACLLSL